LPFAQSTEPTDVIGNGDGDVEVVTAIAAGLHIEEPSLAAGGVIFDDPIFPIEGEKDVLIYPHFLQANGFDPDTLMTAVLAIPMVHGTEPIPTDTATFVGGDHIALMFRGSNAPKHKFQFTTETEGIPIYHYTGWTWLFTLATYIITMMPMVIQSAVKALADSDSNHFIVAMYKDGNDYIGPHFDKAKDIQEGSNIDVWKLGAPRKFVFEDLNGKVLWEGTVPAGSLIRMSLEANLKYKHSVPKDPSVQGLSASIVGRHIKTVISGAERDKSLAKSALFKRIDEESL
jgi:hypothetical protein